VAQRVTVTIDGTDKFIGMLEGGTLMLERSKSKHFYRKLNAYGMDKHILNEVLPGLECQEITIHEKETDDYYTVDLETFQKKALPNHYKGHGAQLFLPLRYWRKH
jgi:hypothetical protein